MDNTVSSNDLKVLIVRNLKGKNKLWQNTEEPAHKNSTIVCNCNAMFQAIC